MATRTADEQFGDLLETILAAGLIDRRFAERRLTEILHAKDPNDAIRFAFSLFLGRAPDRAAWDFYSPRLAAGADRFAFLGELANSEEFRKASTRRKYTCTWLFNTMTVLCDGSFSCGCADPFGLRTLGHLQASSVSEAWTSHRTEAIRTGLRSGYSPFCFNCPQRMFGPSDDEYDRDSVAHAETRLTRLFVEPTILCNLSCLDNVCASKSALVKYRNRPYLPLTEFKAILDDVGPQLNRIDLFNFGESFLNKDAAAMIEYVKERYPNIYLFASTNGNVLTKDVMRRLISAGMDALLFSVDGADQESYSRYRCKGDFDKVYRNMAFICEEKEKTHRQLPYVIWRYILFAWNDSEEQMATALKLARKCNVDQLLWTLTDFPAPSTKFTVGSDPWKSIYSELWETSDLCNALSEKKWAADIAIQSDANAAAQALEVGSGMRLQFRVSVTNVGGALWRHNTSMGRQVTKLGVQLYDGSGRLINDAYASASLTKPLGRGMKDTLLVDAVAVPEPGNYILKADMYCEGINANARAYFEKAGSIPAWKSLHVRRSAAA